MPTFEGKSRSFQGLRQYKEKFDPIWEPRFLATPGGLPLPRILTHIGSLIARQIFAPAEFQKDVAHGAILREMRRK